MYSFDYYLAFIDKHQVIDDKRNDRWYGLSLILPTWFNFNTSMDK